MPLKISNAASVPADSVAACSTMGFNAREPEKSTA
jgi:hypothetical protein